MSSVAFTIILFGAPTTPLQAQQTNVDQPTRFERFPVQIANSEENVSNTNPIRSENRQANAALPLPTGRSMSLSRPRVDDDPEPVAQSSHSAVASVIGSLAIVLGLFFVLVWATRRTAPTGTNLLPTEVLEPLGRAPLAARQQMQLIRLGNRLILLSVTPQGAETLAEVTDPAEVERIAAICQQGRQGSVTASFQSVLTQFANEPAPGGFVGSPARASTRNLRTRNG